MVTRTKKETKQQGQRSIRIDENTARLLRGFSQRSLNAAIQLIWTRVLSQGKDLKAWREATGCKTPLQYVQKKLNEREQEHE